MEITDQVTSERADVIDYLHARGAFVLAIDTAETADLNEDGTPKGEKEKSSFAFLGRMLPASSSGGKNDTQGQDEYEAEHQADKDLEAVDDLIFNKAT